MRGDKQLLDVSTALKRQVDSVAQKLHNFQMNQTKIPRLNALARNIDEIWCFGLAEMDKLSQWNWSVKFLLDNINVFFDSCESSQYGEKEQR